VSSKFVVVMSVDLIKRVDGPMLHVIVYSTPTHPKAKILLQDMANQSHTVFRRRQEGNCLPAV